jgi:Na+-driven multidrug efflux pump
MKRTQTKQHEMNMVRGPILSKVIRFSLPVMLTGILQLLYNAADIIVVGQYSDKEALAAVGSTGSLINLLINVCMGLSVGTSVAVAQQKGAGDLNAVRRTVHTSISLALYSGIGVGVSGDPRQAASGVMGAPADVIDASALYIASILRHARKPLYTFGSAILRAVGDTKRPLYS